MDTVIVTGPDRLLQLVNEHSEITLTAAANELRVDQLLVEEWSDMLSEAGLLDVEFTLTERMIVSKDRGMVRRARQLLRMKLFRQRRHNERDLQERAAKVQESMNALDAKLKELDRYRLMQRELTEERQRIDERRRAAEEQERALDAERQSVARERADVAALQAAAAREREEAMAQQAKNSAAAAAIAEREKAMVLRERAVAKREARVKELVGKIAALCEPKPNA